MAAKKRPLGTGVTWSFDRDFTRGSVTPVDDCIIVWVTDAESGERVGVSLTRTDARMLAKRLTQCLDATVRK